MQQQSVLLQGTVLLLRRRLPAAWLQLQDGPARLGLSRLGSARPTDTMTYIQQLRAAAAAALTSLTSASIRSAPTTLGSIANKYRSGGFSYLSVKSAALYCPDFFFSRSPSFSPLPLLLLCGSSSRLPPPPRSPLRLIYQQTFNLYSIKKRWRSVLAICPLSTTVGAHREQAADLTAARSLRQAEYCDFR